jgi:riboflavin synthase
MFTGLVEETGALRARRGAGRSLQLTFQAKAVMEGMKAGDSVAVNGCCLTVVRFGRERFTVDVMPETYEKTNLRELRPGARVNLERTLRFGDRLGGHLVQGHIDGTGTVRSVVREEIALRFAIAAPPDLMRYIVPKGSIAVDGISLTVVTAGADRFEVSVIPHTAAVTTLGLRRPGETVNLEVDLLAKYVERLLGGHVNV